VPERVASRVGRTDNLLLSMVYRERRAGFLRPGALLLPGGGRAWSANICT